MPIRSISRFIPTSWTQGKCFKKICDGYVILIHMLSSKFGQRLHAAYANGYRTVAQHFGRSLKSVVEMTLPSNGRLPCCNGAAPDRKTKGYKSPRHHSDVSNHRTELFLMQLVTEMGATPNGQGDDYQRVD